MTKLYRSLLAVLVLILFFSAFPPFSKAAETEKKELGFWVELQAVSSRLPAKAIVWYERELTEQFGFFAFAWNESDGYREYIAGLTWKPFDGAQVGCGIGRETMSEEGSGSRRSCFAEVTFGKVNVYAAVERGGFSGRWHKVTATYALNEKFGVGVMKETDLGFGPRLEYNVPGTKMQVWGVVLHDRSTGENTSMLAVNFSF